MLPIGLKSGLAVFFCKALVFSIKWYFFVKWKTKLCKNNFKQFIYQEKSSDNNKSDGSSLISIFIIICFDSSHRYFPPNLLI